MDADSGTKEQVTVSIAPDDTARLQAFQTGYRAAVWDGILFLAFGLMCVMLARKLVRE